ncbi:hypothetical protein D3C81_1415120 [compost metagenome]
MPVKIDGEAAGSTTLANRKPREAPIERAESISSLSTCFTPLMVLSRIGQNDAQKMIATLDSSPMPKNKMNTGNSASAEVCRKNCSSGSTKASRRANQPISRPRLTPLAMASSRPASERYRLASMCLSSAPFWASSQIACSTADGGLR